jgi:hypothetical protein
MAHLETKHVVERKNLRVHRNKIINWVVFEDILLIFCNSIQYHGDVSPDSYASLLLSRHLLRGLRKSTKNLQLSAYWIQAGSVKSFRIILVCRQEMFLNTVTDIIISRYLNEWWCLRFFSEYFCFPSVSFHHRSSTYFLHLSSMLLNLSGRQLC